MIDYQYNSEFIEEYFSDTIKEYSIDDIIKAALEVETTLKMGEWDYSSSNYLILGKIIKAITNNTLGQEFEQRIFQPAEMKDTYFMPDNDVLIKNNANGYKDGKQVDLGRNYFLKDASGGIVSTLDDMQKFAHWITVNNYQDLMMQDMCDCFFGPELSTQRC